MNLTNFNVLLTEGRIDDLKAVYVGEGPNKIPEHMFNRLLQIDPSENKKYFQWMCIQMAKEQGHDHLNMSRLQNLIPTFDNLIKRNMLQGPDRDLNVKTYPTIEALFDKIHWIDQNPLESENFQAIKEYAKTREKNELIFENNKTIVLRPRNKENSIFYGGGTKWCTTASLSQNYFNNYYNKDGDTLYYIIPKINDIPDHFEKVALRLGPKCRGGLWEEIENSQNTPIPPKIFKEFLNKLGIPWADPSDPKPGIPPTV